MRLLHLVPVLVAALSACPAPAGHPHPTPAGHPEAPAGSKPVIPKGGIPARLELGRGVVVVDSANGPQRFKVELAVKDHERQRGLMYRESLGDDEGMLFLFERQEARSFWMKNTWLPLDMLFIDDDLVVRGIVENAEPLTLSSRKVAAPTRHVLELRGGLARTLGIAVGSKVTFEGVPPELWQKNGLSNKTTTTNTEPGKSP